MERFQRNLDAIRTLKTVEAESRAATAEEQAVLAQYVGWGGLADFFDEKNPRYAELKELLTDAEYAAARESTLTAFYTPPVVIRGIYAALGQLGFTQGNILEPSCGIGNFLGMLPESMSGSKLYGVEWMISLAASPDSFIRKAVSRCRAMRKPPSRITF